MVERHIRFLYQIHYQNVTPTLPVQRFKVTMHIHITLLLLKIQILNVSFIEKTFLRFIMIYQKYLNRILSIDIRNLFEIKNFIYILNKRYYQQCIILY